MTKNLTAQWADFYRFVLPRIAPPCDRPNGGEGDRTPDLVNAIHALSQLSYAPVILCRPQAPPRREHGNLAEHFIGVKRNSRRT